MSERMCPICGGGVSPRAENAAFPFCSPRCQMVDLGRWLDGDYRIAGEFTDVPDTGESWDPSES